MERPSKEEIVASSAGWLGVILNIIPGLGTGYIYQRRWKAYWITTGLTSLWLLIMLLNQVSKDSIDPLPDSTEGIRVIGLLIITIITAVEAGLQVKKSRE